MAIKPIIPCPCHDPIVFGHRSYCLLGLIRFKHPAMTADQMVAEIRKIKESGYDDRPR